MARIQYTLRYSYKVTTNLRNPLVAIFRIQKSHMVDITGWSGEINAAVLNIVLSFRHTPNSNTICTVQIA